MNLFSEYVEYLKDNPQGYWFKRKLYGYGWVPATKQGWSILAVYVLFVLGLAITGENINNESVVILPIVGATLLFLAITIKTGEPIKWQWGKRHGE